MNKIFANDVGRQLFVKMVGGTAADASRRNGVAWLGRLSFQNLKHVVDLFLYEA